MNGGPTLRVAILVALIVVVAIAVIAGWAALIGATQGNEAQLLVGAAALLFAAALAAGFVVALRGLTARPRQ
ncbi:MAG TPA: hypothetical protein VIV06_06810 [Candidatus Limnocylindrales bacterium]